VEGKEECRCWGQSLGGGGESQTGDGTIVRDGSQAGRLAAGCVLGWTMDQG
jgi:hypothetical protein